MCLAMGSGPRPVNIDSHMPPLVISRHPANGFRGEFQTLSNAFDDLLGMGRNVGHVRFMASQAYVVDRESHDGKHLWVALFFRQIARREVDQVWRWPNLDAHITLHYGTGKGLPILRARMAELQRAVLGTSEAAWTMSGLVNIEGSKPHYAWVDLHVQCRAHETLHRLAHILHEGNHRVSFFWNKRAFHVSLRSRDSSAAERNE